MSLLLPRLPHKRTKDLHGMTFGRWTVQSFAGYLLDGNKGRIEPFWWCLCACGTRKRLRSHTLIGKQTLSCGCRRADVTRAVNTRHGQLHTKLYKTWQSMHARCRNPYNPSYQHYGGRGITVCLAWQDFLTFAADMGQPPTPRHTLERRNTEGHYEPGNCLWATQKVQQRNRRNNRWLVCFGERRILQDWAEHVGIDPGTISDRLKRGWSIDQALTVPVEPKFLRKRQ